MSDLYCAGSPIAECSLEGSSSLVRRITDFGATRCCDGCIASRCFENLIDSLTVYFIPCEVGFLERDRVSFAPFDGMSGRFPSQVISVVGHCVDVS